MTNTNTNTPAQLATQACDFDNPRINLEDVAWGLSHTPRYNGACWHNFFNGLEEVDGVGNYRAVAMANFSYTVAQHSVLLYQYGIRQGWTNGALAYALFHDAPESIYGDVTNPVKRYERRYLAKVITSVVANPLHDPDTFLDLHDDILTCYERRYKSIDAAVMQELLNEFPGLGNITEEDYSIVEDADSRICADEFRRFKWEWTGGDSPEPLGVDILPLTQHEAYVNFKEAVAELAAKVAAAARGEKTDDQ